MDLGPAPVRLAPDGHAEVVWGRRIDPARIVVVNVPTPDSGQKSRSQSPTKQARKRCQMCSARQGMPLRTGPPLSG